MRTLIFICLLLLPLTGFSQSYQIKIPGKEKSPGFYEPSRIYNISKPNYGGWQKGVIYVKSKEPLQINSSGKLFEKSSINPFLATVGIKSISRPFEKYLSGNRLLAKNSLANVLEIRFDENTDPFEFAKSINDNPEIEYAVPLIQGELQEFIPNDTEFVNQYFLEGMQFPEAWDIVRADSNIVIGIVDSGIDLDHEDLRNVIKKNWGEIPGDGKDNDNNGFVDDFAGWDFVGGISLEDAISGIWQPDANVDTEESNNHGTHVAGLAAAETNNQTGVAGTSFGAKIIPVKITLDNLSSTQGGSTRTFRPYDGIMYCIMMGADIINCSWTNEVWTPLQQEILDLAEEEGILITAAAGNSAWWLDRYPSYPAKYKTVMGIGAADNGHGLSSFSNYGSQVDVYAAGVAVLSTYSDDIYRRNSGTSMAAPVVSGLAALVKKRFPEYTPLQIRKQIRLASNELITANPAPRQYFFSSANALKAVTYNHSGNSTPGLHAREVLIKGNPEIRDTGFVELKFTIENVLSSGTFIKMKIIPQDDFAEFSKTDFEIGHLASGDHRDFTTEIKLGDDCPWYSGEVNFLLEFSGGSYLDYERITLPIELPTTNKFIRAYDFDPYMFIEWTDASSPGKFDLWAGGKDLSTGRGIIYRFPDSDFAFKKAVTDVYAVHAWDSEHAIAAISEQSGAGKIIRTTDAGLKWEEAELPQGFGGYIFNLEFEGRESIFFGKTSEGYVAAAFSDDYGKTWELLDLPIEPNPTESVIISGLDIKEDRVIQITNQNNFITSPDFGKNWEIHKIPFPELFMLQAAVMNRDTTMIIADGSEPGTFVLVTEDGGKTWEKKSHVFPSGLPVRLFSPDSSNMACVVFSRGEMYSSSDFGDTWQPVRTKLDELYDLAFAENYREKGRGRMWQLGSDIGYLDYDISPRNPVELLEAPEKSFNFDTLEINKRDTVFVFLENKGNLRLPINPELEFAPGTAEGEFAFAEEFPVTAAPGELIAAELEFAPGSHGEKSTTLRIPFKDEFIEISLEGFGLDPSGIEEENSNHVKIYPNPAANKIVISSEEIIGSIRFYNSIGELVLTEFPKTNLIEIPVSEFSKGAFTLEIQVGENLISEKIIIIR
jgi:subtilisin family serine protease